MLKVPSVAYENTAQDSHLDLDKTCPTSWLHLNIATASADNEIMSDYHQYLVGLGYEPDRESLGKKVFSRPFAASLPEEHTKATYLGNRAGEFIERNKDRPFAICVNFLEPHTPLIGPLDDLYDPAGLPQSPAFMVDPPETAAGMHRLMAEEQRAGRDTGAPMDSAASAAGDGAGAGSSTEQEFRKSQARYYGLVTLVDRAVGRILGAIDDAGIADRTIVVFTSDHGDQMGEHNIFQKIVMYEGSVKVPFLVRVPWLEAGMVTGRYSHIDTVPTLLDLLGLEVPGHLQGVSRAGVLRDGGSLDDNDVFIDWNGRGIDLKFPLSELERMREIPHRAVVTGDGWKLNLSVGDQCELYDLNADPYELVNLFDDTAYSDRVVELARKIRRWQVSARLQQEAKGCRRDPVQGPLTSMREPAVGRSRLARMGMSFRSDPKRFEPCFWFLYPRNCEGT